MSNSIRRLIPNLLTAGNLVGGILAIILSLTGRIELAPYCIIASAIFDFLDGFVARLLKVQSELGKQLDSLADMVTFGVAPGIICYYYILQTQEHLSQDPSPYMVTFLPMVAFIIPVFALFRLAKFNLDTRQTSSFIGLPTPAMTLFFAVIPVLGVDAVNDPSALKGEILMNTVHNEWVFIPLIIIMSVLMVVEIPLFALKFSNFKWKGNQVRYIFLTISAILLATLFFWAVPLIIILYIILSLINNTNKNEIQS